VAVAMSLRHHGITVAIVVMFVADNDIVGIVTNHLVTNHWHLVVSDIAAADAAPLSLSLSQPAEGR
jgi:hypothetical protein